MNVNVDLIFKIAGLGILISVLHIILKQANKEEQAQMVTLAGVVVVLIMVVQLINQLFTTVRSVFHLF
jgi:stage III sporulation protein AC